MREHFLLPLLLTKCSASSHCHHPSALARRGRGYSGYVVTGAQTLRAALWLLRPKSLTFPLLLHVGPCCLHNRKALELSSRFAAGFPFSLHFLQILFNWGKSPCKKIFYHPLRLHWKCFQNLQCFLHCGILSCAE